jgi:hypothetical protein
MSQQTDDLRAREILKRRSRTGLQDRLTSSGEIANEHGPDHSYRRPGNNARNQRLEGGWSAGHERPPLGADLNGNL